MHDFLDDDFDDIESFEKFYKAPKTGKVPVRKGDHQIRVARREKEKVKTAILEEADTTE